VNSLEFLSAKSKKVWVVAEISGNHAGKLENCIELIKAAKYAGADAVKLQTYKADTLTLDVDQPDFLIPSNSPWVNFKTQYALYENTFTPWEWHSQLFKTAKDLKLTCFSSPFDESAVEFLEALNCPIYKLASPEINHLPLIRKIAETGKPIIMSLGVATKSELDLAVSTFTDLSSAQIVVLHCDTNYPALPENANLTQISQLKSEYPFLIGYSDHTLGTEAATTATALGARVIEKHIRLETKENSPDSFFSTGVESFKDMVKKIRFTEKLLGSASFRQTESSKDLSIRRSVYPARNIEKNELISSDMLKIVRPGYGIEPKYISDLIGTRAKRMIYRGERVNFDDFEIKLQIEEDKE
jgi:pseudaminic acid synthase